MTTDQVVQLIHGCLLAAFWLALPLLAIGFATGILISLVQVLTSLQDSSVSTIPRLLVYLFAILALLPWMVNHSVVYAASLLGHLDRYAL
jgi:flagellar biosynthetic protein FliQ